ncbi:hypothetical protein BU16DRAFT_585472 [Lophium mytilinum]|uniref:Uncharacterized protein n=1 Tax=Lophium mytilinum TaxID=390894 RepID=A0A6A6QHX0_9PEZI|nr:hypothetical protein BU16DRAFT_585472 [Lophium mytilinum]
MVSFTATLVVLLATTALAENVFVAYPNKNCSREDEHKTFTYGSPKPDGGYFSECQSTQWLSNTTGKGFRLGGIRVLKLEPGCNFVKFKDGDCSKDLGKEAVEGRQFLGHCGWWGSGDDTDSVKLVCE